MIIYIIFFSTLLFLLTLNKNPEIIGLEKKLAYIILFLFCALRFDVGYDYMYYFNLLTLSMKHYSNMLNRLEPLNKILIHISQFIKVPQFYFIVTSFLIIYPLYRTIKNYSKDFVVSTLLFLSFPIFFFNSLSIVRQYVAVILIFYSFKYIKERNFRKFFLVIIISFLFHKSAIFAVVLYWLYGLEIRNIYYIILYIIGFFSSIISYYLVKYFVPEYLVYLDKRIGIGGDKVLLIFQILGFLFLFFINKETENKKDFNFYSITFYMGLFIWSSLSPYGHAGFRGALYFLIFFILLLPEIIYFFKQKILLKQITYVICAAAFVYTLYLGTTNPHKDPNIPYRISFFTNTNIYKKVK